MQRKTNRTRPPTQTTADRPLACANCGYLLTGLADSANCPECSYGIALSRQDYAQPLARRDLAYCAACARLAVLPTACLTAGALAWASAASSATIPLPVLWVIKLAEFLALVGALAALLIRDCRHAPRREYGDVWLAWLFRGLALAVGGSSVLIVAYRGTTGREAIDYGWECICGLSLLLLPAIVLTRIAIYSWRARATTARQACCGALALLLVLNTPLLYNFAQGWLAGGGLPGAGTFFGILPWACTDTGVPAPIAATYCWWSAWEQYPLGLALVFAALGAAVWHAERTLQRALRFRDQLTPAPPTT